VRRRERPSVSRGYYSNRNEAFLMVRVRKQRYAVTRVLARTVVGVARAAGSRDHRTDRVRARVRATIDGLRGDLGWKAYRYLDTER
jgi:hypothetical protein